jgi:hypothetical protein
MKNIPPSVRSSSETLAVTDDKNPPPIPPPMQHAVSLPPSYSQVFREDGQNGKFKYVNKNCIAS